MSRKLSLLSQLLLSWVGPFIRRNFETPLSQEGLLELPEGISAQRETEELQSLIDRYANRSFRLHRAILMRYRAQIIKTFLISIFFVTASLCGPLFLKALIQSLQGKVPTWFAQIGAVHWVQNQYGTVPIIIALACILALNTLVLVISIHHVFLQQLQASMRVRLALGGVVYRKSLLLHRSERAHLTNGSVINHVGTDTNKVEFFFILSHSLWVHPIQLVGILFLLYGLVGSAALYGALVVTLGLCFSALITRRQGRLRRQLVKLSDTRVGLMNEILTHIKTVKIAAWEDHLGAKVIAVRQQEIAKASRLGTLGALNSFISISSPMFAMVLIFSTVVNRGGALDAAVVFPTLAFLFSLRHAIGILPETLFNLVETHISLTRLDTFFRRAEWRPPVQSEAAPRGGFIMRNAEFSWGDDSPALSVGNLEVLPGELLAIVGTVGSGKSALFLGLLGEIALKRGTVALGGSVAYIAQQPWIASTSVRNNILMDRPFDPVRYQEALIVSNLATDLSRLPAGDATEIGERGVNLSGGQKQRLSIARAYYADAEIFLFDDPLSALDHGVADSVFEELCLDKLRHRARVMITHRFEYALKADRVVVIEGGAVVASDSPERLLLANPRFKELFKIHSAASDSHDIGRVNGALVAESSATGEHVGEDAARVIEVEDREVGAVDRAVVREYVRRFVPGLLIAVFFALFASLRGATVSMDLWIARYSSLAKFEAGSFIWGYLAFAFIVSVLSFSRAYFVLQRGLAASLSAHAALLRSVLHAPMRFFESNPVGRILNRFSRDIDAMETSLPRSILDTAGALFEVLSVICINLVLQPITIFGIVPIFWLYHRLQRLIRPTSRELQRLESVTRSPVFGQVSESLNGVDTIRAFGLNQSFQQSFYRHLDLNGRTYFSMVASNRWLGIRIESLGALLVLCASVGVSFLGATPLGAALGGFVVSNTLSVTGAMNWFVRMLTQTESSLTSFERIEAYSQLIPERYSGVAAARDWPQRGAVEFEAVLVRYRQGLPPALRDLSFSIQPGERIGVIGRTGSGKSTLIASILRLLECERGRILIDGIDIAGIPLMQLREAITVIPQEPVLFSGRVRESVDPYGSARDEDIWEALRRVELKSFVESLPHGLNAPVLENGSNFSSGQRQLLCLARALMRSSRIILMDEATANIDVETDAAVQRTIRSEFAGTTVIVVAHRLGTIMDSDRILILDHGRLEAFDSPLELQRARRAELEAIESEESAPLRSAAEH